MAANNLNCLNRIITKMSAEEIKELLEFKRKTSLFLNLDFV